MADNDSVKINSISFAETMRNLSADNTARLKHLGNKPTLLNKIFSYLWPTMVATFFYRMSHYFYCKGMEIISLLFFELNIIMFGCDISPCTRIGKGFVLIHVVGIAIQAKIGDNALIFGQAGIGGDGSGDISKGWFGGPVIGDNCIIGYRSTILGPVKIGDNVFIKANTFLSKEVPDDSIVGGMPVNIEKKNSINQG